MITVSRAQETDDLDKNIQKNRTGVIVIKTAPNTTVKVEQLKHEFWFGCAINGRLFSERSSDEDKKIYREKFLENFNSAVTESALKWGNMEREKGKVNFTTVDNMLEWTDANDIPLRGHNLYWGIY